MLADADASQWNHLWWAKMSILGLSHAVAPTDASLPDLHAKAACRAPSRSESPSSSTCLEELGEK